MRFACLYLPEAERELVPEILRALDRVAPHLWEEAPFFGASYEGLELRYAHERHFVRALEEAVQPLAVGPIWSGVAADRFTARVAASEAAARGTSPLSVPTGREASFLAPLSLTHLGDEALRARLRDLGITTLGAFAALSPRAVRHRFGPAGVEAQRAAAGRGPRHGPTVVVPPPLRRSWELEPPRADLKGILRVFERLVRGFFDELVPATSALEALEVALVLDPWGERHVISLRPARPCRSVAIYCERFRHALEGLRFDGRAIRRLDLRALGRTAHRPRQRHLFDDHRGPVGVDRDLLVHRLEGRLGVGTVGRPLLVARDLPERSGLLAPWNAPARRHPGAPPPGVTPTLAALQGDDRLRLVQPPRPVQCRRGMLLLDRWRPIEELEGPFRLSGSWWDDDAYRRVYVRCHLRDGLSLLLFRALEGEDETTWFLTGILD